MKKHTSIIKTDDFYKFLHRLIRSQVHQMISLSYGDLSLTCHICLCFHKILSCYSCLFCFEIRYLFFTLLSVLFRLHFAIISLVFYHFSVHKIYSILDLFCFSFLSQCSVLTCVWQLLLII